MLKLYLDWVRDKPIEVVISSTWRTNCDLLSEMAFAGIRWKDITPDTGFRGKEIQTWLERKGALIQKYAILDDQEQFYSWQNSYFVQTSYIHGLRPKDLEKIETILEL